MEDTDKSLTSSEELEALREAGKLSTEDYETLRAAMNVRVKREGTVPRQRLYKCWTNRQLGGVCGGLGEWMGVEPWIIRCGFLLAFLFTAGLTWLIYIVLYLVLPWKETERDQVARFPFGLAAGIFGVWLVLHALIFAMNHWFLPEFQQSGRGLPFISQMAIKLASSMQQNVLVLFGQVVSLAMICLLCGLAPANSPSRRVLAGVTYGALFLLISLVLAGIGLASAVLRRL